LKDEVKDRFGAVFFSFSFFFLDLEKMKLEKGK